MAAAQVGLLTSGKDLKGMLAKTGFNTKKLDGVEKLDILEYLAKQLEHMLETRGQTHLALSELVAFLRKEGMSAKDEDARGGILMLEELKCRERARLGKHVGNEQVVFQHALNLIPDSEIKDVFALAVVPDSGPKDVLDIISDTDRSPEDNKENPQKRLRLQDDFAKLKDTSSKAQLLALEAKDALNVISNLDRSPEDNREPPQKRLRLQDDFAKLEDTSPRAELLALEDQILAAIDPNAIQEHLPVLGECHEGDKDDFTKMRGIGRWMQRRLNRIKIYKFRQLANMTPAIEADVAKAIRYFPGRIQSDLWVFQAEKLSAGKEWIVNPVFPRSGTSQVITIAGEKYERELVDIARNYGSDGRRLGMEHAECLWFSAMDGQKITALERLTLRYIIENFQFEQSALVFLKGKLGV